VLIDCGLSPNVELEKYNEFDHYLKELDIILLSSSELEYAGALPFIVSKYNFKGKILSTVPIKYMASLCLQNFTSNKFPRTKFSQKQIQTFYDKCSEVNDQIIELKFRQKIKLTVKGIGFKLECFQKGTSIGSCFWSIS
jgi:Cft2 family RNA processing exonuclease